MPLKEQLKSFVQPKDNPIKTAAAVITTFSVIAGAIIFVDERYAHAEDLKEIEAHSQQAQAVMDILKMEKEMQIMMLELKKEREGLTPEEKVQLEQLKKIVNKIEANEKKLQSMKIDQ